ncbi:MAG: transglutaminase domain-containing protein, partial [Clostridia bacterium]|nr:transglutaminase domain-containing protein [Clostridia bacterium]
FPENGQIAPEDAPQRTVCWEETMQENHEFCVEYSYIHTAKYHDVSKIVADPVQPDFCTEEEAPHIVFTPYIRELVRSLSEGTDDPLEKARRFYDFITLNMKYTFMPAYFILENIAETCARNFTGDCGVFTLLFITMCRCAGIPAQWQSGFTAEPDFLGGHDWARFYIAPYGWLYADPSYGTGAVRADNEERRRHYFGNLDPFRMVANNAFQREFTVEKQHWRGDPYDNQVGEMETTDRGFAYTEYERSKEILLCEEISI